jgi:DNA-binding CsgD family transcriptional regulator
MQCLTPEDAREMLRLTNALHRSPAESVTRKKLLLQGICRLVEADSGVSAVTICDRDTARQTVVSIVRTGRGAIPEPTPGPTQPVARIRRVSLRPRADGRALSNTEPDSRPLDNCLCYDSYVDLLGMQVVATLTVCRRPADSRPFSQRQREIVNALHAEMAWVYGPDLLMTSPEALALPPQKRETLAYLLAGDQETQIAAKIEMSRAAVHNHVKALYRHFNVASRRELLDKWPRR